MGYPQFVTQMYFRSELIKENEFLQELNKQDLLLQSDSISEQQREKLVVEFTEDSTGERLDGLVGNFDITLTR